MVESVRELRKRGHASASDGRIEYTEVTALYSPALEGGLTFFCVLGQLGSALGFFAFIAASLAPTRALVSRHVCFPYLSPPRCSPPHSYPSALPTSERLKLRVRPSIAHSRYRIR